MWYTAQDTAQDLVIVRTWGPAVLAPYEEGGRRLGGRLRSGILFEETPEGDVAEIEGVPVEIEGLWIELHDGFAGEAERWRDEAGERVANLFAIGTVGAGEKMPESESIARAGLGENCGESGRGGAGRLRRLIEGVKGGDERGGGVFEIRSAGAEIAARGAHGTGGDKGLAAVEMEANPADGGANGAGAVGVDVKRVGTAEIDSDGGRGVDDELSGRSPDGGVDGADVELEALVIWIDLEETNAGIGIDANFAEIVFGERGAGNGIGGESLADVEFSGRMLAENGLNADLGSAFDVGNVPGGTEFGSDYMARRGEEESSNGEKNDGGSGEAGEPGILRGGQS